MSDAAARTAAGTRHTLVAVFGLALVVRAVFAWTVPPAPIVADAADYDRLAQGIVAGRGYVASDGLPTSERPPLYSVVLAGAYAAFGTQAHAAMRALQGVVDALTCMMVYLLALRHFGAFAARSAAVLAIFSLSLLYATRHLLAETFAAFFMTATVLALDLALAGWAGAAFVGTGALVGLSTLTKGTTLVLPAALLVPVAIAARGRWRPVVRAAVLLAVGFVLILLPWTVRNYRVHGELVPVATQMGWVIYSSYAPPEGRIFGVYTTDETVLRARVLPEAERSRVLTRAALDRAREHADQLPQLVLLKLLYFVSPFDWEFLGGDGVINFTYVLMLPLALYGLWAARRAGWTSALLALPAAFLLLLSLVLYGSPRIRFPAEPALMALAAGGAATLWARAGAYRPALAAAACGGAAAGFAAFLYSTEVKVVSASLLHRVGLW